MADEGVCVYIVGEDEVHRALGMALIHALANRLAQQTGADWFEFSTAVRWSALEESDAVPEARRWTDIHRDVAPPVRRRLMGHIQGRPVGPGAQKLRGKLVECARASRPARLVVLFHDTDGDSRLLTGAQQVIEWAATQDDLPAVVIGTPAPEAEAWFLLTDGLGPAQQARLDQARAMLNFDPTTEPERLTSKPPAKVTDAKRVVQYVLLEAGTRLAEGHPDSKAPTPERADALAERLAGNPERLVGFAACGIGPFLAALDQAVANTFRDHLPPP